jgi:hypothetical protein
MRPQRRKRLAHDFEEHPHKQGYDREPGLTCPRSELDTENGG